MKLANSRTNYRFTINNNFQQVAEFAGILMLLIAFDPVLSPERYGDVLEALLIKQSQDLLGFNLVIHV